MPYHGAQAKHSRLWLRVFMTILLIAIIMAVGEYAIRTQVQPASAKAAVAQLEDSDTAFRELQELKQAKDYINIGEVVLAFVVVAAFWGGPIIQAIRRCRRDGA